MVHSNPVTLRQPRQEKAHHIDPLAQLSGGDVALPVSHQDTS